MLNNKGGGGRSTTAYRIDFESDGRIKTSKNSKFGPTPRVLGTARIMNKPDGGVDDRYFFNLVRHSQPHISMLIRIKYRVGLVVWQLGWVDHIWGVPPAGGPLL